MTLRLTLRPPIVPSAPTRLSTHAPRRLTLLAARLRAGALDRALMAGADPAVSPRLAARAAHLTARPTREALAQALEARVHGLQAPPRVLRVGARRAAVRDQAGSLRELATRLRAPEPLYAGGIATVSQLLCDGTSPLYGNDVAALARTLHEALATLHGDATAFTPSAPCRAW